MAEIYRAAFFKKLNSVGYRCFEAATVAAKTAGNPYIGIVALTKEQSLRGHLLAISGEFAKIKVDNLTDDFAKVVAKSPEEDLAAREGDMGGGVAPGETSGSVAPAQMGKQEALKKFTTD